MTTLQRFADPGLKTALWLIGFLPFLNPVHTWPIPSFYSEWLAGVLALLMLGCSIAMLRPATTLTIPRIVLLPLVLTAAVLIQLAFDHVAHPGSAILYCGFLLLAGALMVVAAVESKRLGPERVARIFATAFVAGALLQSLVLLLQRAAPEFAASYFPAVFGAASGGILGQRNHLVDYLWLGIASLIYLMVKQRIPAWSGTLLMFALAVASVLPGSRSAYLYPLGLAAVASVAWYRSRRLESWRKIVANCLLTIPLMLVADHVPGTAAESAPTATERLAATANELDPVRSGLLQVAWQAASERPFSGFGVAAAPRVSFEHATSWPANTRPVVAEHFHNLFAQWLVEFGFPLTFLAAAFLLHWLLSALRLAQSPEHWWLLSMLAVVGLHSQVEYPLWLAYFLIPSALLAGAADQAALVRMQLRPRHLLIATAAIIAAGAGVGSLLLDYRQLEIAAATSGPGTSRETLVRAIDTALALEQGHSPLAPQAIVLMTEAMGVSRQGTADRWMLCQQALRISPTRDVAFKCAAIAALSGKNYGAGQLLRSGTAMYGNNPSWRSLKAEFPELEGLQESR